MSTAMRYEQCPQCGYRGAWYLHDCRSAEESLLCPACGCTHEMYILTDRKKSTPDNRVWKRNKAGEPIFRSVKRPGYGVVQMGYNSESDIVFTFRHPPSEAEIQRYLKRIMTDSRVNANASYITRWDADSGQVVVVYGQLPSVESVFGENTTIETDLNPDWELMADFCFLPDEITN